MNEVDLLLVNGSDIFPIEIKSGMTITRDYFKGLTHLANLFPRNIRKGSGLVYAGDEPQQRTAVSIVPFRQLNSLFSLADETG